MAAIAPAGFMQPFALESARSTSSAPTAPARWQTHTVTVAYVAVVVLGIILRARQLAAGRSLWLDEAVLALSIIDRSWLELFNPVAYSQGGTIGFLAVQKIVVDVFGTSEFALRLFPFASGVISLFLMAHLARATMGITGLIALWLFAFSTHLIYFASEAKRYSSDVLVSLCVLAAARCWRKSSDRRSMLSFGAISVLSIWLSHPAVFVVAGADLVLFHTFVSRRNWRGVRMLLVAGLVQVVNFLSIYAVSLGSLTENTFLRTYWRVGFVPLPPWSDPSWFLSTIQAVLADPAGFVVLASQWGAFGVLVVGFIWLLVNRRAVAFGLAAGGVLLLLASALEKYPVSGRMMLFSLPIIYMVVSVGVSQTAHLLRRINSRLAAGGALLLAVWLVSDGTSGSIQNAYSPEMREHITPVLTFVADHALSDDVVYVYYAAMPAFRYYARTYDWAQGDIVAGTSHRQDPRAYLTEIDQSAAGFRTWFIFSHNCSWCTVNEESFIVEHLNRTRVQGAMLQTPGASAYLYTGFR